MKGGRRKGPVEGLSVPKGLYTECLVVSTPVRYREIVLYFENPVEEDVSKYKIFTSVDFVYLESIFTNKLKERYEYIILKIGFSVLYVKVMQIGKIN